MISGKWLAQGEDISQALAVRAKALGAGRDEADDIARQAVIYDERLKAVATGRLLWQDGAFRVSGVCVLPEERSRGYGDLLVRMIIQKALSHGAREICLISPESARGFFARYGFTEQNSEPGGVAMTLAGERARLSRCAATPS